MAHTSGWESSTQEKGEVSSWWMLLIPSLQTSETLMFWWEDIPAATAETLGMAQDALVIWLKSADAAWKLLGIMAEQRQSLSDPLCDD